MEICSGNENIYYDYVIVYIKLMFMKLYLVILIFISRVASYFDFFPLSYYLKPFIMFKIKIINLSYI